MEYVSVIVGILEGVLGMAQSATTGQVANIIGIIDKALPYVESLGESLATPLTNIIAALSGNGSVTAAQLQTLQAQSASVDAALDAAAKADGLSGADDSAGS